MIRYILKLARNSNLESYLLAACCSLFSNFFFCLLLPVVTRFVCSSILYTFRRKLIEHKVKFFLGCVVFIQFMKSCCVFSARSLWQQPSKIYCRKWLDLFWSWKRFSNWNQSQFLSCLLDPTTNSENINPWSGCYFLKYQLYFQSFHTTSLFWWKLYNRTPI